MTKWKTKEYNVSIKKREGRMNMKREFDFVYHLLSEEYRICFENDITKSRDILKSVQVDVYQIATQAFPDAKLSGGYTWREYKYKYIKEGLFGWAWDSWTNYNDSDEYYLHGFGVDLPSTKLTYSDTYVTTFHWCPKADGYFD